MIKKSIKIINDFTLRIKHFSFNNNNFAFTKINDSVRLILYMPSDNLIDNP